jgi:hypothetical protein
LKQGKIRIHTQNKMMNKFKKLRFSYMLGICYRTLVSYSLLFVVGSQFNVNKILVFFVFGGTYFHGVVWLSFFMFWNFKAHKRNRLVFYVFLNMDSCSLQVNFLGTKKMWSSWWCYTRFFFIFTLEKLL